MKIHVVFINCYCIYDNGFWKICIIVFLSILSIFNGSSFCVAYTTIMPLIYNIYAFLKVLTILNHFFLNTQFISWSFHFNVWTRNNSEIGSSFIKTETKQNKLTKEKKTIKRLESRTFRKLLFHIHGCYSLSSWISSYRWPVFRSTESR